MGRGISRGGNADASQRRGDLIWDMDQFVTRGPRTGAPEPEKKKTKGNRNEWRKIRKRKLMVQSRLYAETFNQHSFACNFVVG